MKSHNCPSPDFELFEIRQYSDEQYPLVWILHDLWNHTVIHNIHYCPFCGEKLWNG